MHVGVECLMHVIHFVYPCLSRRGVHPRRPHVVAPAGDALHASGVLLSCFVTERAHRLVKPCFVADEAHPESSK